MKLFKTVRNLVTFSRSQEKEAWKLYLKTVEQARLPVFYQDLGTQDNIDGRYDVLTLHVCMMMYVLDKKSPQAIEYNQDLFDVMFEDMEYNLREMGVGDLAVKHKMKAMWSAFNGRRHAYYEGFNTPNTLAAAIARNLYRGEKVSQKTLKWWESYIATTLAHLTTFTYADLIHGKITFQKVAI